MPKEEKMTEIARSAGKLFTFTIDASTAQVVKLESEDASGARHELSEEERASLAREGSEDLVLRVQDQGVGIPAEDVKRIFRRFYRVTHRSLTHVKGTGLGLFIVKAIAKKHGGKVFAESGGVGEGTTIVLELPRWEA